MDDTLHHRNNKVLKKGLVISSILSFIVLFMTLLTTVSLFDFIVFYNATTPKVAFIGYIIFTLLSFIVYCSYTSFHTSFPLKPQSLTALNNVLKETSSFVNKHRILEMFTKNLMSMVENNYGIGMWIKDEEDRYIFANAALRDMLFDGTPMYKIVGKTDGDLFGKGTDYGEIESYLRTIPYTEYPNIKSEQYLKDQGICNFTDIITRIQKKPCRFYEEVNNLCLDVYKTPLVSNKGDIIGTVGTLFDVSHNKEMREAGIILMETKGKAFKINGSNNYYITEYSFGDFI